MNKYILIAIPVILVILGGIFLLSKSYGNNNMQATSTNATNTPTAPDNVVIENYTFTPSTLTVKVGETVTWTNNDSVAHSVKSNTFNSPDIPTNGTYKFTFNTKGTFNYNCGIHPSMSGTIVVQ